MNAIVKGIGDIFNKITEENFPKLEKRMPIQIQETYRTPGLEKKLPIVMAQLKHQKHRILKEY